MFEKIGKLAIKAPDKGGVSVCAKIHQALCSVQDIRKVGHIPVSMSGFSADAVVQVKKRISLLGFDQGVCMEACLRKDSLPNTWRTYLGRDF